MVNHRGTVVSFAMDDQRRIYYAVLDISQEDKNKGPLDVKYWVDNPQLLSFPAEIEQVGFAVVNPVQMPTVKKDTRLEASATTTVSPSEADVFLSTTARLTADAPFQVFSDNQHIYVFRQSLAGNHADMVHKLKSGGSSGTETDLTKFVTDSANKKVPLVTETLLVDRFILAGTALKLPREVRFRRSENRTNPASAKDSLGAKDMEGNAFSETTKELDFIRNLSGGCFSVILLPTQVADIERWQLFAYNKATKLIDSFNIERSDDGFFNTQGTQLYTSPDDRYKTSVLERKPGTCPFTALPLVPTVSKSGYAEWALKFDGTGSWVDLADMNFDFSNGITVEAWVNYNAFNDSSRIIDFGNGKGYDNILLGNYGTSKKLMFQVYLPANRESILTSDGDVLDQNQWNHVVASVAPNGTARLYKNGTLIKEVTGFLIPTTVKRIANYFGRSNWSSAGYFQGQIDEVRIWNRARSGSEIKETMNHRLIGDELGLAGYWRFDEAAGTQVKDLTSNGNHGTLSSDAVKRVASDAPIGEHPGMQRTSFAFADREVETGLAARLYYQQEKLSSAAEAKSVKQNARVLLTAVTSGLDPIVPVSKGLALYLAGESYLGGNQWDDFSGQGRHAFTTYGSPMPSVHQVTNYNNKNFPVMRFVSGPPMRISIPRMSAPFTAIIVDRYFSPNNSGHTLASAASGAGNSHWHLGKRFGKNLFYTQKQGTNDDQRVYVAQAEDAINNVFSINTGTIEGTSASWYLDGVSKGSATIPSPVLGDLRLGDDNLNADVACVLVWDRVLTDNERQTVEKWLGTKYGINVNHSVDLSATAKKYVAAVDFDVSRAGKLAQVPDNVPMPPLLSADPGGVASDGIIGEISSLETDIPRLEAEIVTLNTEIVTLDNEIGALENLVARIPNQEFFVSWFKQKLAASKAAGDDVIILLSQQGNNEEILDFLKSKRDHELTPKRAQRRQKNTLLQSKQGELNVKNPRLTELRKIRTGTPQSQPMKPFHTDPRGLMVSSGLLGFAYTDSQPYLFESALGRMAIYFKGANKQFFSAYYDVNTGSGQVVTGRWKRQLNADLTCF